MKKYITLILIIFSAHRSSTADVANRDYYLGITGGIASYPFNTATTTFPWGLLAGRYLGENSSIEALLFRLPSQRRSNINDFTSLHPLTDTFVGAKWKQCFGNVHEGFNWGMTAGVIAFAEGGTAPVLGPGIGYDLRFSQSLTTGFDASYVSIWSPSLSWSSLARTELKYSF